MKTLLLADQCNHESASLPSFSYSLAKSIANDIYVTPVTHIRSQQNIGKYKFKSVNYIHNECIITLMQRIGGGKERGTLVHSRTYHELLPYGSITFLKAVKTIAAFEYVDDRVEVKVHLYSKSGLQENYTDVMKMFVVNTVEELFLESARERTAELEKDLL